jgi:hypothetical protein
MNKLSDLQKGKYGVYTTDFVKYTWNKARSTVCIEEFILDGKKLNIFIPAVNCDLFTEQKKPAKTLEIAGEAKFIFEYKRDKFTCKQIMLKSKPVEKKTKKVACSF